MRRTSLKVRNRSTKNILFYSDSPIFGGHEAMSVRFANEIATQADVNVNVTAVFYQTECLEAMTERIKKTHLNIRTPLPLPFIRSINPIHILQLIRLFKQIEPDILVLSQGDIEFGLKALYAAKLSGCFTVSYIPMAYSFRFIGARFGKLRDLVNRLNYKLPDAFITINNFQKQLLKGYTTKSVYVLPNVIEMPEQRTGSPKEKKQTNIELGIVGRVKLRQKNQMYAIELLRELRKWNIKGRIHIVGDGSDLPSLKRAVKESGCWEDFVFHGWVEKNMLCKLLNYDIDVLLIPSRYEGVPLILLEALSFEKKFLITDFPWLDEYSVPPMFRLDLSDISASARKLIRLWESDCTEQIRIVKERFMVQHAPDIFQYNVAALVAELLNRSGS